MGVDGMESVTYMIDNPTIVPYESDLAAFDERTAPSERPGR